MIIEAKGEFKMKTYGIAASMLLLLFAAQAFAVENATNSSITVNLTNESIMNINFTDENANLTNETLSNETLSNETLAQDDSNPFAGAIKNRQPGRA